MGELKQCPVGHYYDPDLYPVCPVCNGDVSQVTFGTESASGAEGKTMAPGMGVGAPAPVGANRGDFSGSKTVAPSGMMGSSSKDSGVTVPPNGLKPSQRDDGKTHIEGWSKSNAENGSVKSRKAPVVGWLVCVEGPDMGESYSLRAKNNAIGRDANADVRLTDESVSREHAWLRYDDRYNKFYLNPNNSSTNSSYLNCELIFEAHKLADHDMIEFGKSKMIFVPFCDDRFDWSKSEQTDEEKK